MLLQVKNLHTYYGLSHILFGISLSVKARQLACLLGRNGAGKSTTLRSIIGLAPAKQGAVLFRDRNITRKQPYQIARLGIGYVPEERFVFPTLTVRENLDVGARVRLKKKAVRNPWSVEKIWEVFPKLESLKDRKGGYLSGGEQQMLTIARTLMGCPDLLLLDEPCEGLAPLIVKMMGHLILDICASGNTILLAEQNVKFALEISEYGFIIENGVIQHEGPAADLSQSDEIKRKFLAVGKA